MPRNQSEGIEGRGLTRPGTPSRTFLYIYSKMICFNTKGNDDGIMFRRKVGSRNSEPFVNFEEINQRLATPSMVSIRNISWNGENVRLRIPLDLSVSIVDGEYNVYSPDVGIFGTGPDFDSALSDFSSAFILTLRVAAKYGRSNEFADAAVRHVEGA